MWSFFRNSAVMARIMARSERADVVALLRETPPVQQAFRLDIVEIDVIDEIAAVPGKCGRPGSVSATRAIVGLPFATKALAQG